MRGGAKIGIALLSAGLAAAIWLLSLRSEPPATVAVVAVTRGEITETIRGTGQVRTRLETALGSLVAGQIRRVAVEEGRSVAAGELLAELDDSEPAARLTEARAELARAEQLLRQAEDTLSRLTAVWRVGGESGRAVAEARGRSLEARQGVLAARSRVELAQVASGRHRITAPFAGLVTEVNTVTGALVQPGQSLFVLVDPERREVAVRIQPDDAERVAPGQVARIYRTDLARSGSEGRVLRLDPTVRKSGNAAEVTVWVSLAGSERALRLGQQVDVSIETARRGEALLIPFEALIGEERSAQVAVVEAEGVIKLRRVSVGLSDASRVEVVEGLHGDERLALPSGRPLASGQRVVIDERGPG